MTTHKTSELTGPALDWAVAKCEKIELIVFDPYTNMWVADNEVYSPSTDWSQAGPIIEREGLGFFRWGSTQSGRMWTANNKGSAIRNLVDGTIPILQADGPTPLVAAMRCYVLIKLGEEVEIPGELALIPPQ